MEKCCLAEACESEGDAVAGSGYDRREARPCLCGHAKSDGDEAAVLTADQSSDRRAGCESR